MNLWFLTLTSDDLLSILGNIAKPNLGNLIPGFMFNFNGAMGFRQTNAI